MRLDLNTAVIPEDRKIWVVHPGKNKKQFADFEQRSRIFLEYPGLNLTAETLEDDNDLRRRIKYSIDTMRYSGFVRPNGSQIRLADFDDEAESNVAVYLRTIKHLFLNMRAGDLVIVPGWGAYSRVLFGEVIGNVNFDLKARIHPYEFADIQYRAIKWLTSDRTKPELGDLVRYVNKPPAIAEVARDDNTDRFFDFAYDSYVKIGQSWSTIVAPNYRSNDPGAIADTVRLIEFAVATYRAIDQQADISGLNFDEIIGRFYSVQDIEHFGLSFASPGRLDFKARDTALSIYVAAFIALASVGGLSGCKAEAAPPTVENSATASPQLNTTLESQLGVLVNQISNPTAQKADSVAESSKQKTGLRSSVEVKK